MKQIANFYHETRNEYCFVFELFDNLDLYRK